MSESAESDIQGAYVGAPCKLICVRKAATAAQLVVARPMSGTTLSAEGQYRGSAMESQEQSPGDVVTAGEDSHPITQAIDAVEVTHAGATAPAANTMDPPTIPLAPMKRMQARFNPLADGLMYVVVFVGGFVGVGCRHALDMLLPSVSGTPFVVGTFVSNMVACFLFAMLTEFMATASWLRRRVRQVVSRGSDAGTAVTEYSKAGSGCVFSCFRVRFCRIGHAGRTPCESGRRGAFCRAGRNGSRADGPADCTDGTGSASRNANRAADCHPAYADRPRSADSSTGCSSADTVIAAVVARAGYFRLGAAARADSAVATNPAAPAAVAADPAAG